MFINFSKKKKCKKIKLELVQKLRKTSYFLHAIVDIAFLMKSLLFKTLNGI